MYGVRIDLFIISLIFHEQMQWKNKVIKYDNTSTKLVDLVVVFAILSNIRYKSYCVARIDISQMANCYKIYYFLLFTLGFMHYYELKIIYKLPPPPPYVMRRSHIPADPTWVVNVGPMTAHRRHRSNQSINQSIKLLYRLYPQRTELRALAWSCVIIEAKAGSSTGGRAAEELGWKSQIK